MSIPENLDFFWLTVSGAVHFDDGEKIVGYMHPEQFKKDFGQEAFAALLAKPRVRTCYDK